MINFEIRYVLKWLVSLFLYFLLPSALSNLKFIKMSSFLTLIVNGCIEIILSIEWYLKKEDILMILQISF